MNQSGYNSTGSVKDFYLENSYGQLNLEVTVVGPYIADFNRAFYGANNAAGDDSNPQALIVEALQKANPAVNYADFDNDGDGKIDGVHVIFAGHDEAAGASPNAIWSHRWSITGITLDGKLITDYSCSSELRSYIGSTICGIGTVCHEMGHDKIFLQINK
jgi:M6 family metalloprotease-like protein